MKRFNNFRRLLRAAAVVTVVAAMTFAGCTKVDVTLGSVPYTHLTLPTSDIV